MIYWSQIEVILLKGLWTIALWVIIRHRNHNHTEEHRPYMLIRESLQHFHKIKKQLLLYPLRFSSDSSQEILMTLLHTPATQLNNNLQVRQISMAIVRLSPQWQDRKSLRCQMPCIALANQRGASVLSGLLPLTLFITSPAAKPSHIPN